MPPCPPPQNVDNGVDFDDAVEMTTQVKKDPVKPKVKTGMFANTFHWELNLYSFSTLGFIYYMLPEDYRIVMKVLFGLIAVDALRYYQKKGSMAGVPYTLPFVTLFAMLIKPVRFWAEMANIAMASESGICTNTLVGNFLLFVVDPKLCRDILTGEGTFGVYAHPNAMWLFGPKNLIYLDKEPHKAFRSILTPALFSNQALELYAKSQEMVVRKYMMKYSNECKETKKPVDLRIAFRTMAAAASQEAFLGPYITDEDRIHLEQDILTFTLGFLCIPFPYLGTGLHKAIQAKDRIEATIRAIVPKAREYVQAGNEPRCMMEHWALSIMAAAKELGVDPQEVPCCHDDDMARTVLDFLFAAQDATNSALTYAADVLEARPDVMEKVTQEVESILGTGAKDAWAKVRDAECLPYTAKVANQLLHHKPPVPMIPHITKKATKLGGHPIGPGTVTIPSIFYSARVSGASTEFIPEREDADPLFVKCVTFGGGQHKCPGRRYAESLLTVFLAIVSANYRFERVGPRPDDDDFIYFPTLFPSSNDFLIKERA